MSGLPAPDVAWYLNGRPVQSDDFHKMIVSEKGFHSLIFEVVRVSDAGAYVCVAKNRAGEATFTVQLDVLGKPSKRSQSVFKPAVLKKKVLKKKILEDFVVKVNAHTIQSSRTPVFTQKPRMRWKYEGDNILEENSVKLE